MKLVTICVLTLLAVVAHAEEQRVYQRDSMGNIMYDKPSYVVQKGDLLDRLEDLVPEPGTPGPLEILEAEKARLRKRQRAPRRATAHGQKKTPASENS